MTDVRVIVADDDPLVVELVSTLLADADGLACVGTGGDGLQAVALAAREQPDVAVLDVRMPSGGGQAVRAIHEVSPATVVLALSSHEHESLILEMLNAGAQGYLLKGLPTLDLAGAIRAAAGGETVLSGPASATVVDQLRSLSGRVEDLLARTEQLELAKEEFIQILAHELLTPTTVMQASADTVGRFADIQEGDVDLLRQLADRTSAAAQRLRRIVDNLSLAAQLRDDRWEPRLTSTPVGDLLRAARDVAAIDENRFAVHGDEQLPVLTDARLLARALGLVLENAVDHGDHVEVAIETDDGGTLAVCVRDDGPGFPEDFRGGDAFTQADSSTTRAHGGLGIGLYLTALIMQRIEGALQTGAGPAGGAEVRLVLPGRAPSV